MGSPLPRRPGPTTRRRVIEVVDGAHRPREDTLAVEEPLEIRLEAPGLPARRLAITMRTPGHDFELAAGWVVHEGLARPEAVGAVRYCTDRALAREQEFNVVTVALDRPPLRLPGPREVSSACGVCGTDVLAEVVPGQRTAITGPVSTAELAALPQAMLTRQSGFASTGGLHAAGLFGADLEPVVVREDVGRHNAVDKVVGSRVLAAAAVPPVLVLSGRIAFELVHKAITSGVSIVVAVGAPTSLAVRLAVEHDLTLIGFTRPERCVVYAGEHRVGV